MSHLIPSLPGYRQFEYLLVLGPHEDLRKRIMKVKEEFAGRYKNDLSKTTRPHIALLRFVAWSMMEEKIMQRLQTIAMSTAPFKIELNGFGSLPSHTIFINVTTRVPVQNLLKSLRQVQPVLKAYPNTKPHFMTDTHIAIACQLKPEQYEKGWNEYARHHFTGRFIADGMLLLKRPLEEKGYQIVKRMEFMNLPLTTVQGELFGEEEEK
jgi:2'-5' RNA ligase